MTPMDPIIDDLVTAARAERAADLDRLAGMSPDQIHYLGHLDQVPDPATDGLECDADT